MGIFICRCGGAEETSDYDNINSYEGETRLGKRHGKGVYYYEDGSIYDGQWQWGKKHGYGTYTFRDGTKKIGFFYNDDYLGDTPGKLFSEPDVRESDPAKPLMKDYSQLTNIFSQESSEELKRRRREREERQKESERRRKEREERQEARRQKREEIRKKYDL